MGTRPPPALLYQRSHFVTALPADCLYSASHAWLLETAPGRWRVGLTKFATRMLGEMVDHGFEVKRGAKVRLGQVVGWAEGFKAISDLYCVVEGVFLRGNPALRKNVSLVTRDPHAAGWIYEVRGRPDARCLNVEAYRDLLDKTIDRLLEKQKRKP